MSKKNGEENEKMKNDILGKKEQFKVTLHIGVIEFFMRLFKEKYNNYETDRSMINKIFMHLKELKSDSLENGE